MSELNKKVSVRKVKEAFNTAKGWIMDKLSFLSLQNDDSRV